MDRDCRIPIDPQEYKSLEEEGRKTNRDVAAIANDLIKRHNFVVRVEEMRKKLIPLAKKAGYNTEEDIFRDVS